MANFEERSKTDKEAATFKFEYFRVSPALPVIATRGQASHSFHITQGLSSCKTNGQIDGKTLFAYSE